MSLRIAAGRVRAGSKSFRLWVTMAFACSSYNNAVELNMKWFDSFVR